MKWKNHSKQIRRPLAERLDPREGSNSNNQLVNREGVYPSLYPSPGTPTKFPTHGPGVLQPLGSPHVAKKSHQVTHHSSSRHQLTPTKPSWPQLDPNLSPTWPQLGPTWPQLDPSMDPRTLPNQHVQTTHLKQASKQTNDQHTKHASKLI